MLQNEKIGKLSKEQKDLIDQLYRGNERILVLVKDLLNLSKLQEGKFEVVPKAISLKPIIKEILESFRISAAKKKLSLSWKGQGSQLPQVYADPNRVSQVITNLISNAIKYTPDEGRVTVSAKKISGQELHRIDSKLSLVKLFFTNNKKGYLMFSVKDSGIGITRDQQKKIFTKFFRAKNVMQSKAEGTGLGLYITKSIVNLHKGDIWFTSLPGIGSTFYFTLPIVCSKVRCSAWDPNK